ncbi:MAG TPA: histidine kinase [Deltaproteobacteria bacterium]|nr:histidine kinase [Deltaproteobacteria bacterium]
MNTGSSNLTKLRARIENINSLPTIPAVLERLLGVIDNPRISLSEISDFIANDPALTTRVLRMVNSPVYGFPGRISSVSQAVVLLGVNVVKGLLLGVSVFDLMQKSMVGLWEHSLGCAVVARLIAKEKGVKEPEEVSVAGLIHDLGKVILYLQIPDRYERAMELAERNKISIAQAEQDCFDTTHAQVGSWIAAKWNFPTALIEPISYHHRPQLSKGATLTTAIVHVADLIIRARGFGFAGDRGLPLINPVAWDLVGLSEDSLRMVISEMEPLLLDTEELTL